MMDFILINKEALIKEVKETGTLRGSHTFEFMLPMKGGREGSQSCRLQRSGFGSAWMESQMA